LKKRRKWAHLERQHGHSKLKEKPHQSLGVEDELISVCFLVPGVRKNKMKKKPNTK
jgi:hypothetical protein